MTVRAYIGDALRDVQTGRAAGMATVVAAYGYLSPAVDPTHWGPDGVARRPELLGPVLRHVGLQQRPPARAQAR